MICPHCTVGEISEETGQCGLCGSSSSGNITLERPVIDEIQETVQRELEGRFHVTQLLGRGTRSVVYAAEELEGGSVVALKVIPMQRGLHPDFVRFEREAGVAATLAHSHIVPVFDFGRTRALLWYSMELVKGESLAEVLQASGRLSLETCLTIVEQTASALDYVHRRGTVHGNVKPSNILLDAQRWVRLADAAVMSAFSSRSGGSSSVGVTGMLEYAAPERFRARAGSASIDQYSLAVVTYQCLSGSLPFVGDAPEEIERLHRSERPPLLAETRGDIPPHVDQAIQRAMSKAVVERFPNVLDFVSMLRGDWAPSAPQTVVPEASTAAPQLVMIDEPGPDDDDDDPSFRPVVRQRSRWRQLALIALAVVLAESAWLWFRSSRAEPEPEFVSNTPAVTLQREAPVRDSLLLQGRQPGASLDDPIGERPSTTREQPPVNTGREAAAPATTERATADSVGRTVTNEPARQPVVQPPPVTVPTRRDPLAAEPGLLAINSTPWGQLFIDGRLIGNTPLRDLLLTPGTHMIRVERRGFIPFELEVEVAPGQQLRLTDIVLRPEPR